MHFGGKVINHSEVFEKGDYMGVYYDSNVNIIFFTKNGKTVE